MFLKTTQIDYVLILNNKNNYKYSIWNPFLSAVHPSISL